MWQRKYFHKKVCLANKKSILDWIFIVPNYVENRGQYLLTSILTEIAVGSQVDSSGVNPKTAKLEYFEQFK